MSSNFILILYVDRFLFRVRNINDYREYSCQSRLTNKQITFFYYFLPPYSRHRLKRRLRI